MVGRTINGKITIRQSEDPHVDSVQFYSKSSKTTTHLVAMMPLLVAPAHEWSTMLTVLKQAQNITTVALGKGHKTVIIFDLQLYEQAMKLQMHTAPALDHGFPARREAYCDGGIACSWVIH